MANNKVTYGNNYSFTSTGSVAYTAGDIFVLTALCGVIENTVVASTDTATWATYGDSDKKVVVDLEGVYTLPVVSTDTVAAAGVKLYAVDVAGTMTATTDADGGANPYLGISFGAKTVSNTVDVKLNY